jgi:hypothetical protein
MVAPRAIQPPCAALATSTALGSCAKATADTANTARNDTRLRIFFFAFIELLLFRPIGCRTFRSVAMA